MKRINKRTLAWGVLTAGVLSAAAFADDMEFVKATSEETVTADATSKSQEEVFKLLFTEDEKQSKIDVNKLNTLTAGAGRLSFAKADYVMFEQAKAGAVTLEGMHIPLVMAAEKDTVTPQAVTTDAATPQAVTAQAVTADATTPQALEQPQSEWADKVLANVEDEANVRADASAEAQLVGKIRRGARATVLEKGEEWTRISSGNVTGYVKNEYLVYGDEAENLANQLGKNIATIQGECVNVRKEPNTECGIYEQVDTGKEYTSSGETDGWVAVNLKSGATGYVNAQYVTTELRLSEAITVEEEQAEIQAKKEAEEKAAQERAAKEKAAQEKAAQKAASQEQQTASDSQQETDGEAVQEETQSVSVEASVDEMTLLAGIIEVEAGTDYENGIAVANVILNRVNSSSFPNSITGVIYQKGQFPGAHNGKLARILSRGPASTCYESAQAALSGQNLVGGRLYFNYTAAINFNKVSNYVIIGDNCFY